MFDKQPQILLIEDDPVYGQQIKESLEQKKYRVEWQTGTDRAFQLFRIVKYDLCILDAMLPGKTGHEFAKEIRKRDFSTPILFISTTDQNKEMIEAFCSGGDDYLVKPFSTTELALRVYALLRRTGSGITADHGPDRIFFGQFTLDYPNRLLCSPSGETSLTKKEAELLRMLALNMNSLVKREKVLTNIWGENDYFMGRSMDVYITRLRKKLSEDKSVSIQNVHRMGFKLEVNEERRL
ncbi:MAG: response regulator transcription factor [Bacteroidales bacterium]|nr:response regulator transcription factor [Bacteroidales bacterium]